MNKFRSPSVVIAGAGMSGICMAITLLMEGFTEIIILEKSSELGGTWRDNIYPGLSCDVPSRFYQYTFAPKPDWSHLFSPGEEINQYFSGVAEKYKLNEKILFNREVVEAHFCDGSWLITDSDGIVYIADFFIAATGVLHNPKYPDINGIDNFEGVIAHSARWSRDTDVVDKRIGIIGTGSTGVQLVCGLSDWAAELKLFQRTPQWVLPLPNPAYRKLTTFLHVNIPVLNQFSYRIYRRVFAIMAKAVIEPGWQRKLISSLCRLNLRTVRNKKLRTALTPDYEPMCRRLVMSAGFYRSIQKENAQLVDTAIKCIDKDGVITIDGNVHKLDIIILATGFDAHAFMRPMQITGRGDITLDEAWARGPKGYMTVSIPDFPNFFMLMGPHSPVGNYSLVSIAETQSKHITSWIKQWSMGSFDTISPTHEATEEFNDQIKNSMSGTVWTTGCTSWYLGADGIPELWPWTPDEHRKRMGKPDFSDYDLRRDG
ncbi:MAG: flavin-containing monooxygenase [Mycobacteriaceae bacterium]